jgi:hypothetical protein
MKKERSELKRERESMRNYLKEKERRRSPEEEEEEAVELRRCVCVRERVL